HLHYAAGLAAALALLTTLGSAQPPAGGKKKDAVAKFIDRITKALPESAPAKPKQRRKGLIFTPTPGFRPSSIPAAVTPIPMMGDKTGAYLAHHTEDESFFEPEKLRAFDAVLMLNTTGDCLRPRGPSKEEAGRREEELKKSLADFVSGGKGLAGIH